VIARNDAATFTAFLDQLNRAIAPDNEIHVVLDNGSSHTARHTKAWLAAHPRWHVHWTPPHASWLNQAVRHESRLRRADSPKEDRLMSKV
jgi:transposase